LRPSKTYHGKSSTSGNLTKNDSHTPREATSLFPQSAKVRTQRLKQGKSHSPLPRPADEELKVIIIAWSAFIPVTLNTYRGIRAVPARYREVGQVLTFGPWSTLTKIVLPAALPTIFVGIREGLANSWQTLVAAELFASSEGLGYLMAWGRQLFQLDLVIMAMIAVGAIGLLFNWGLGSIERRLQRWQVAS